RTHPFALCRAFDIVFAQPAEARPRRDLRDPLRLSHLGVLALSDLDPKTFERIVFKIRAARRAVSQGTDHRPGAEIDAVLAYISRGDVVGLEANGEAKQRRRLSARAAFNPVGQPRCLGSRRAQSLVLKVEDVGMLVRRDGE